MKNREKLFKITADKLRHSVNEDNIIIQLISEIQEIDKAINLLIRRLDEFYSLYFPELRTVVKDNEMFARLSLKTKKQLMKELKIQESVGSNSIDPEPIKKLAESIVNLFELKSYNIKKIEKLTKEHMPNTEFILGAMLSAKMLAHAGSLKKLATVPASTIQTYGAETALFRHLKSGSKSPKYGILINHQFVMQSKNKGKAARVLADKVSICARVDYFKGEFIGDKIKKQIERAIKK